MSCCRSDSNPGRWAARYAIYRPSDEYAGLWSLAGFVVIGLNPSPSCEMTKMSLLVLVATLESELDVTATSRPDGARARSCPPSARVGTSRSIGVRSVRVCVAREYRRTCWRRPTRHSLQWRYKAEVQIRASVGYSPFRRSTSDCDGHLRSETRKRSRPSRDHWKSLTLLDTDVSLVGSPPRTGISQTWVTPSRVERKPRRCPSGLHRGARSVPVPSVICHALSRSVRASQIRQTFRFSVSDGTETTNATSFPPGDSCRSLASLSERKSSTPRGCGAPV